jgi:restriction endonuclease Mrr
MLEKSKKMSEEEMKKLVLSLPRRKGYEGTNKVT